MTISNKKLKILVFRYRFLGDTILTVPFLQRLREAYPNACISVLIAPQSGVLLQNCPYINELIEFDTTRFHKYDSGKKAKQSLWDNVLKLKKEKFDIAYILKRSFSSAVLAFLAGITERIGFNTEFRSFLLTKKIPFDLKQSEVINFLNHLPAPFNEPPDKKNKLFWPTEHEKQKALSLINSLNKKKPETKNIIIHAPAAHPLKMWKIEYWAELIKKLKIQNHNIIFSGSSADNDYYAELQSLAGVKADLNLCLTDNTLRENIAVYELCDFIICVDSGPLHLAAAVNLKGLAIFGPTDPVRWQPWSDNIKVIQAPINLPCRPCNLKPICQNIDCVTELKPDFVLQNFLEL